MQVSRKPVWLWQPRRSVCWRTSEDSEAITREYNASHAARRQPIDPAELDDLRSRGRDVGRQLSGAGQPAMPAESAFVQRPTYSTPDKNLRAAEQIAIELEDLEGDERRQQT